MTFRPLHVVVNQLANRVAGTVYVNGPKIREVNVSFSLTATGGGTATKTFYNTVSGGTALGPIPFGNILVTGAGDAVRYNAGIVFMVDPGASYSITTVLGAPGGLVTLSAWIETDTG